MSVEVKTSGMIVVIFVVMMGVLSTRLDTQQLAILGIGLAIGLALVIFVLDIWVYRPVNGLIRRSRRRLGSEFERQDPHDRDEIKELEYLINTIIHTFTEVQVTSQSQTTTRTESDLLRLQTYNRQLVDVSEIGKAITAAMPYRVTVDRMLERSKAFLKADFAALISLEKNTRAFELQASVGVQAQDANIDCCLYTSDCPVRRAVDERGIVRSRDHTCTLFPKTMKSQLILPLQAEGLSPMALLATSTTSEFFDSISTNVLGTLQGHIESSLGNAHKYDGIRTQVSTDHLTRLYNRRFFTNQASEELEKSLKTQKPLSLVMLDIDHFKHFNDEYGHQTGDKVLQVVAQEMQRRVRRGDVCSRYGGEEFVMLLPNTTGDAATHMADRIRRALSDTRYTGLGLAPQTNITVSMGVATCPRDATSLEELIELADKALYQAKAGGRDRVVQYGTEPTLTTVVAAAPADPAAAPPTPPTPPPAPVTEPAAPPDPSPSG